ncbi:MYB DNA-binding domain protein [Aspergillus ruber CBS 135680]|uniref:MYB DNA-binding domain protein n=1 Tax=Aspergillus ruber (strain CBS 135680) TaxID=1388766 RepID=A0A017SRK3_ASPRC|nr:uncharacterized protein EURHEDRAFT_22412 [Aspergillus ruber CBS 135680]EYE99563.1 hypothetical protein EURHEDRAFT_22412 [Aspergillus ruber CBS 135680]
MIALQNPALLPPAKVDISLLLKPQDEEERSPPGTSTTAFPSRVVPSGPVLPPMSIASSPVSGQSVPPPSITKIPASIPAKRLQPAHTAESPAKKQSKWSPEEDALIIELRGSGMKWEDISRRLPGRSAISCRLHYQNYLERRSEWDEDKKNKLARLYERFKAEMWSKVAEEMAIPWRAAEAMHWQLGEQEMARRAGVVPFSLSSTAIDPPSTRSRRTSGASLSRPRKGSMTRPAPPPQLPSVEELTAGVPAYAPAPPFPPTRELSYRMGPMDMGGSHGGHLGHSIGFPPRTIP